MWQRDEQAGPSRHAEALVALLLPPACREEVLGDLHERSKGSREHSPFDYAWDAAGTIPLVVMSRIRRTADPNVLLMVAFASCLSFSGSAWVMGDPVLERLGEQWGALRIAIPSATIVLGILLTDAYMAPGERKGPASALRLAWGPILGVALALLFGQIFRSTDLPLAIPGRVAVTGCGMALLLSSAIRLLFASHLSKKA